MTALSIFNKVYKILSCVENLTAFPKGKPKSGTLRYLIANLNPDKEATSKSAYKVFSQGYLNKG